MRILEVTNCRMVALDRDEWAQLVEKARAPPRAFEPMMMMMMMMLMSRYCLPY
jgi:Zn-finger nucleic acid-binding protein